MAWQPEQLAFTKTKPRRWAGSIAMAPPVVRTARQQARKNRMGRLLRERHGSPTKPQTCRRRFDTAQPMLARAKLFRRLQDRRIRAERRRHAPGLLVIGRAVKRAAAGAGRDRHAAK